MMMVLVVQMDNFHAFKRITQETKTPLGIF